MFSLNDSGSYKNLEKFLKSFDKVDFISDLKRYGQMGVDALASATPTESGVTSSSWGYNVKGERNMARIEWFNTNVQSGSNIAILLQYGHGTRTGGYVQGQDYINPAIKPIFDKIAEDLWKQVKNG